MILARLRGQISRICAIPLPDWLFSLAMGFFSAAVFISLLVILNSAQILHTLPALRAASIAVRDGYAIVAPLAGLLFFLVLCLPGRWGRAIDLFLSVAIFGLALGGLWASGQSEAPIVSGLLPWNDAYLYYLDALNLLEGGNLSSFSARRPMFTIFFAFLLWLTSRNLQEALAILVWINAVACFLLAMEVWRTHGKAPAALVWVILFLYYRRFSGSALTENLGFALGVLGITLLWRAAATRAQVVATRAGRLQGLFDSWRFQALMGIFLLTVALNARAGAFFVLPALVFWLIWLYRQRRVNHPSPEALAHPGKSAFYKDIHRLVIRTEWIALALGCTAILGGFVLNFILFRILAPPNAMPFSNFSYSLYGVAAGGKSWTQYARDHPELNQLPEAERARQVYWLAIAEIRQNPLNLVGGALRQWNLLFTDNWFGMYSYIGGETGWITTLSHLCLYALGLVGLAGMFVARQTQPGSRNRLILPTDPHSVLILMTLLGTLLSVPFVPPEDAHKMRPYAATIAFLGLFPAVGLAYLNQYLARSGKCRVCRVRAWLEKAPAQPGGDRTKQEIPAANLVASGFGLAGVVFLGALVIKLVGHPTVFPEVPCPAGQEAVYLRFLPGTYINVMEDSDPRPYGLPNFHYGIFRMRVHSLPNSEAIQEFEDIEPPATLAAGLDLKTRRRFWLLARSDLIPSKPGILGICGKRDRNSEGGQSLFFIARKVQWLSDP